VFAGGTNEAAERELADDASGRVRATVAEILMTFRPIQSSGCEDQNRPPFGLDPEARSTITACALVFSALE
jgi:hypothetical protein